MKSFKTWLKESFSEIDVTDIGDDDELKKEFETFIALAKKYDYFGILRSTQVGTYGYFKVVYDFVHCVYNRLNGNHCPIKKELFNVLKIIPASFLFGTAALAAPLALGLEVGALAAAGIKGIQYLYWPIWNWASSNLDNSDPEIARKARLILATIPDQFREMLKRNKK